MRKKKILMMLALLLTAVTGAWAQNGWEAVYTTTQTTEANWTALDAGSTTGQTLGSAGTTTYYYVNSNLTFTNSSVGGSGLTIRGTVYLYVPEGMTVTCAGTNASGLTGGGAGIELTEGNTLYLVGGGTVNATGGNAANGGNGGNGYDAECTYDTSILGGSGGTGGNGGGGAGAGIGTRGANGGSGGAGGQRNGSYGQETTQYGVDGNAGNAGGTAGSMGTLYVVTSFVNLNASGGSAGSNGIGGSRGKTASQHPGSNLYMASGGGGGGAGGFGGAASNIGTGGPGGGGGGGGAAGNVWWVTYSGTANKYHYAGAYGGKGGKNGDNSSAPDGADVELTNPKYADIQAGGLRDEASDYNDPDGYESGNGAHAGGSGGARGNASTAGTTNNVIATDESGNYLLYSATDWDAFAAQVTSGINYSGKTLKLMADISVSTMAGSSDNNSFKGTFDGQGHKLTFTKGTPSTPFNEEYCAPFRHVREATIQNLKVDGSIYTSQKFAAGLIARNHCASQGPSAHITNCHVSTVIYSSVSGEGRHGGFVAYAGDWSCFYLDIVGCLYTGRLLTNNGTTMCGGFVGKWERPQSIGFSNVLFAPIGSIPEGWTAITDGATFVCADFNSLSYSGCYCTETLGTAQGSTVYSITPGTDVTVANAGNVSNDYKVSGLTFYNKPGFMYNGVFFAASGNDISLTLASSATDKVADGYQASAGTLSGIGTSYTLAMPSSDVTISAASWYPALLPDEGGNYSVNNANDWESFCLMVANGNSFNGKTVKLTTDISVTRKCGIVSGNTQVNAFSGTFDGQGKTITATITDNSNQGTAIFCYINGATIQHLISAGTITSNQNHTSGLVGFASGTNLIKDCAVTATLDITHDYAGGIVGHGLWSTTTIEGCVFAGTFSGHGVLSPNSYLDPRYIGFIWGWSDIGAPAPTLVNCLEAGTVKNIDSLQPIGLPGSTSTTTNCYFTTPQKGYPFHWQYVSGAKQAYTITPGTGVTIANAGTVTEYVVSGITSYGTGIKYRDVLYGGDGDEVSLTLSYETSETSNDYPYDYYVNAGTISGTSNPYTLTMPASNVIVSVDKNLPTDDSGNYLIDSAADWDFFCGKVAIGNSYRGKTVKLNANIDITTPAGSRVSDSDNKPFSGTFLGNNNTITVTLANDGSQGLAPFRYINGATIKDLKVAGSIASSQYHTGGIVGFASGTNLIEDCAVTATINVSSNYAGGIVGHGLTSATTIRGCAFTGTVNGVDGNRSNIGGLWGWSNSGTPALVNCLEAGTYTNIASMHPMGLQSGKGTITNCYYMNPQTGSPRNVCTVSGAKQAYTAATAPANLGNLVQNYGIVKAYANGILFDGKYYVAPATVTLADGSDNTETITGADGYVADVTLSGRTLYKDGAWNTICLPFDVTIAGSPLAGATARPLTSASISGSTLTLTFGDAVTTLEAGTPYIIKWTADANYVDDDAHNIVSPVFSGVTIDVDADGSYDNGISGDNRVRFLGTYKSTTFDAEDKSILLMGGENTLYYPTAGAGIGAQRAYFKIGSDGALLARRLTAFNIDFGDDDNTTGIISTTNYTNSTNSDAWYSLDGRRLQGQPSVKGLYIVNGKKVIVK